MTERGFRTDHVRSSAMQTQWQDDAWLAAAHAWIDAELERIGLARSGPIEQTHVQIWSTVLRVPTREGPVWFKANMEELRQEAAIAELLAARRPELVPPPLVVDHQTGWMLLPDAGEQLRSVVARERSLDRWSDVLTRYADLQIAAMPDVDALLRAGTPDLRRDVLPTRVAELLEEHSVVEPRYRDLVPRVQELVERLAAYGVPDSIQHDDLHDGQVFVKDGRHLVMDWGDSCVSHPFLTLSVTLEGVIAWGLDDETNAVDTAPFRDAYLAPFRERFDGDLDTAADIALRLGWICRAVNGHVPGQEDWPVRLNMFLDGHP